MKFDPYSINVISPYFEGRKSNSLPIIRIKSNMNNFPRTKTKQQEPKEKKSRYSQGLKPKYIFTGTTIKTLTICSDNLHI